MLLFVVALLATPAADAGAAPAPASAPAPAAQTAATAAGSAAKAAGDAAAAAKAAADAAVADKYVCKHEMVTGSRFGAKVCRLKSEVAQKKQDDQDRLRDTQRMTGGTVH